MSNLKPITILLAEDHTIVRQGLSALLSADNQLKIIGHAKNGREAVEMERQLEPAVILMDIAMPVLNGIEATKQILARNPAAKIIVLSAHSEDVYVTKMIEAGAAGFLEKQMSAYTLNHAIREVATGHAYFSPTIAKRLLNNQNQPRDRNGLIKPNGTHLSSRENEVLQLVAEGMANKQVAAQLGISIKTVEKHRQHLMDKLNIHDTAGLTRYAIALGVIESSVQLTIV